MTHVDLIEKLLKFDIEEGYNAELDADRSLGTIQLNETARRHSYDELVQCCEGWDWGIN